MVILKFIFDNLGVFVGFKYIRGCGDRILRHGFNQTALQIHRFAQVIILILSAVLDHCPPLIF
jgi:hypothetical protein